MIPQRARATLAASCIIHFLHDGCSDLLYVLFPLWAREFSLSFAQVGLLRTAYSGALALFQVPAGYLAERWGEPRILAAGTFLTAVGFFCVGTAGGFVPLLVFLMIGGLGSGTQHPLSSSLVSRAYEAGRRRVAIGTYNFSGDLGKVDLAGLRGLRHRVGGLALGGTGHRAGRPGRRGRHLLPLGVAGGRPRGSLRRLRPPTAPATGGGSGTRGASRCSPRSTPSTTGHEPFFSPTCRSSCSARARGWIGWDWRWG